MEGSTPVFGREELSRIIGHGKILDHRSGSKMRLPSVPHGIIIIFYPQLLIFHDVIGEDEEELQNWRKTLPLNGREVCQTSY